MRPTPSASTTPVWHTLSPPVIFSNPLFAIPARDRAAWRQRILVVDDDSLVQEVVTLFLCDAYDISHATTWAEALAVLRREPIALIVLDYRLPDRTGLDVLTELKATRPALPVIMMTGYGSEWICASAFKLGVRDYITKPANAIELVAAVRRILREASEQDGGSEHTDEHDGAQLAARAFTVRSDVSIQKVTGLIQQRYWDELSLSGLAREVGMSKYRLSHRFREVMGVTFRSYLTRVRLERAKTLLTSGNASITEVAQRVGFGDLPRFDKLFKRYTGMTPSGYRTRGVRAATSTTNRARDY